MSQSYAYRLLDQGRIIRELEAAANSPVGEISERVIRDIKPHVARVTAEISERIADGEMPKDAVQATLADVRQQQANTERPKRVYSPDAKYLDGRKRQDRDNRHIANLVLSAEYLIYDVSDVDYTNLDPNCIEFWVQGLRKGARNLTQGARTLTRLARRLERERVKRSNEAVVDGE